MSTTDLILPHELAELDATAAAIPRTELVHLSLAGIRGLVLTRAQALRLGRELLNAAGNRAYRGRAAVGDGRAALSRSAARTS